MSGVVQCSRTLAVHFPPTIYRSSGSTQVLPDLVKSLDITNVQCIQFVPNGIVRVTYKESAQCDAALAGGVSFRGSNLRVTPVDARTRLVYLRDLPAEVPDEPVGVFFRKYGVLHSLSPQFHPGLSDVKNGTRVAKVTLTKDLPSTVRIACFDARLWYQGQPQSCPVCRQFDHRVRDWPLNGLCRRCRQPGHMARECSSRRLTSVPSDPVADQSAPVADESAASAAGVDASMSDEDDPDYVPSSASEPGVCSGDEEGFRLVPTSVLASQARKRSAPFDESSVDLRDNELSPPPAVPGTPEPASAVVVSDSGTAPAVPDPVPPVTPGTPVSASAVVVPAPVPRKKKPRSSRSAVASPPTEFSFESPPVVLADRSPPAAWSRDTHTFWEATAFTGCGLNVRDCTGDAVYMDFGHLTRGIKRDLTSFEEDRLDAYVHYSLSRSTAPGSPTCLPPGTPLKFPE